ncbi:hypothetical protein IE077_000015 [Cardiosporidium cionae]|uniref:Uncharacterized protein n=1 Tax=Cardiosporidium cionae TaxID=476202 RepID=A0ABQ7JDZ6_9APIC|nr:hypothetical protein IE077_000015 [Cardiosporidium cionae]|eukprot:KAF8822223.1 hypothetical protein IE077_000015 [Cardiosporidium cionae]
MNFNRIKTRVSTHYICDPYSTLMHYKRTFKLLQAMRQVDSVSVLCLGSKHQLGIKWGDYFKKVNTLKGSNFSTLSKATEKHDLIICSDMLLHALELKNICIPVIGIATSKEIHDHPEILDVIDYLLPAPTSRTEAALRQLIKQDYLDSPLLNKKSADLS